MPSVAHCLSSQRFSTYRNQQFTSKYKRFKRRYANGLHQHPLPRISRYLHRGYIRHSRFIQMGVRSLAQHKGRQAETHRLLAMYDVVGGIDLHHSHRRMQHIHDSMRGNDIRTISADKQYNHTHTRAISRRH